MKKYIGRAMTRNIDLNGVQMSEELINDILTRQPKVPVTVDFEGDSVGVTHAFTKDEVGLLCEFSIESSKIPPLMDQLYIVSVLNDPRWHREGRIKVVDEAELSSMLITILPADATLLPFKEKK